MRHWLRLLGYRWLAVELAAGILGLVLLNVAVLAEILYFRGLDLPAANTVFWSAFVSSGSLAGRALHLPVQLWRAA